MQWIYQTSEISPGSSAILGNNYIAFYAVHFLAVFIIAVSIASSLVVIINVVTIARRKGKHDFSVRFPIYIAIADALWGTSHLCDHVYLLITQTCPQTNTLVIFTIFMVVWLGYQQCMHAGLAGYMYLKICRNYVIDLGVLEWKLHLLCLSSSVCIATTAYIFDAYGCAGFWMMQNPNTLSGTILEASGCVLCLLLVLTAGISYLSIRRTVRTQRRKMTLRGCQSVAGNSVTKSLTTYIWIAFYIYFPFVLGHWTLLFTTYFLGLIETSTTIVIVIAANSFGWANAMGYFYNQRMRLKRMQNMNCNNNNNSSSSSKPIEKSSTPSDVSSTLSTARFHGLRKPSSRTLLRPTSRARVIGVFVPTPTIRDLVKKDHNDDFISSNNSKIINV